MNQSTMPSINRKATPNPWSSHGKSERPTPQDKRYFTNAWKRARDGFKRKHPTCNHCGEWANVVDHITPVRAGGEFWDSSNWQSLCTSCHNRKSALERIQYQSEFNNKP